MNFWSVVYGVRTFVPRMLAHGEPAHVVNTCSMTSVVTAVREDALYLLTDHEWDSRVVARHEAIMAGAVGPASTGILDAEGVR